MRTQWLNENLQQNLCEGRIVVVVAVQLKEYSTTIGSECSYQVRE